MQDKQKSRLGIISPWLVIGMGLILVVAVTILAAMNFNREKRIMQQVLSEKGSALIRSFEAGTRTGMMGKFGSEARLQTLLTETAAQKDILYIALVDPSGKVLAHSDPRLIGRQFLPPAALAALAVSDTAGWRTIEQNGRPVAFEVYKTFMPLPGRPGREGRHARMMEMHAQGDKAPAWCPPPGWMEGLPEERILDPRQRPVIFIGMDPGPYVAARAQDFKLTLMTSAIIVLLGLAGVIYLYWAQRYLHSRKLLQDSRAFAAEMVANLPEGIIVAGTDRRLTFVNDIAAAMLGLEQQGLPGREVAGVLPAALAELILLPAGSNKVVERELLLDSQRGRKLTVAASAASIVTEEGDLVGAMLILRDLTQVRRLQETIRKQEKMAAVGNLAAGVAHEVRNPLSSIKGYATYFAAQFAAGSEQRKAAEVMTAEVDRLNRVISELLEIARPSDIRPRDTDIPFLLSSSLRLVQQEAEAAGVRLATVIAPGIPSFPLDPDRLTQALLNLYINAIQAMPEGGQLTISAGETESGLDIAVKDSGSGIGPEALDKIFDPYYTTKTTGTGLGLAVVQKVVEAHGGIVRVHSEPGQGTSFILTLPRAGVAEGQL